MKRYQKLITLSLGLLIFTTLQSGCGKFSDTVANPPATGKNDFLEAEIETEVHEAESAESDDAVNNGITAVGGPYGEISLNFPSGWIYEICPQNNNDLTIGLYGIRFRPENQDSDWIELVYTDSFGVCGTGLSTKHRTIAGVDAEIGTYDEHTCWDYIAFEGKNKGIVVRSNAKWVSDVNDEIFEILDTLKFNTDQTEGTAFIYTQESESDDIAVAMDLQNISKTGASIRFRRYEDRDTGELIYGQGYSISRLENDRWEPVYQIIDNAGFEDIAYIIPSLGEAEIETNWEWLYGSLSKGTYRISKTILDSHNNEYILYAQFLIAE